MDTKSRILFWILAVLVVLSVSASYYRYMVLHDYLVQTQVDCDPTSERCFIWTCDIEEEECTNNPDEDTWYYKIAYRNAKHIPACDPDDDNCDQFTCPVTGEEECSEVLCTMETLIEYNAGETCTDPADFESISSDEETGDVKHMPEKVEAADSSLEPIDTNQQNDADAQGETL